jgi:hypothetical protein
LEGSCWRLIFFFFFDGSSNGRGYPYLGMQTRSCWAQSKAEAKGSGERYRPLDDLKKMEHAALRSTS